MQHLTPPMTPPMGRVFPEFSDDPEQTIKNALNTLKARQWCKPGSWQVVITNALAHGKVIDTLQLRQVE
ncbi:MAG: hypothetical protein ABI600_00675 [Luteolibacter sp.]